jgi:putative PEP-CTERM system histidine kinase
MIFMAYAMTIESLMIIRLGSIAKYFHILMLLIVIIILMNLEYTFRSSSGLERWQIKYLLFGMGAILLFYVYLLTQRLLYNIIDMNNVFVMSTALIVANGLITYSVLRNKIIDGDIYVSRKIIYSSFSLIAIGLYSIIVALSAQLLKSLEVHKSLKPDILLIFLAILAMVIAFYKESFRRKIKAFINKNFRKSKYVYQDEWMLFSTELSKKMSTKEICGAFLKALSERVFVKCASIWLVDESLNHFYMSDARNLEQLSLRVNIDDKVVQYLNHKDEPISQAEIFENTNLAPISEEVSILLKRTKAELLVPLILAQKWVGFLTLGKIKTGEPYDEIEDYGLLKSAAAHAASAISNSRLFEQRIQSKEMAAFHHLSSFIMHDLKNTASMLSMVAQNAEKHFHNPDFQKDALRTISTAVARMNKMIASLSNPNGGLRLQVKDIDLNRLIDSVVEKLPFGKEGFIIEKQLEPLPPIRADGEELRKVVSNLLLNAFEASGGSGKARIGTRLSRGQVVVRIADNGPGMSTDFIEESLFQPFKSTKPKGLGIGLYQCKTIIEAHNGKIEVESEPGKGSVFSVYLPVPDL